MSHFAIGDIQGCARSLQALLRRLPEDARLFFCGDLINRGPRSLETLDTLMALGDRARCLLGNHDLHFLATALGVRGQGRLDTLDELLVAGRLPEYVDWLRQQSMALFLPQLPAAAAAGAFRDHLLVHAGVLPQWSVAQTLSLGQEIESALRSPGWRTLVRYMYGNEPACWSEDLQGIERQRLIINALTRSRFVFADGSLELDCALGPDKAPPGAVPWFDHPRRGSRGTRVVFGHWSQLGLVVNDALVSLDTGCVWGGPLTAVELETGQVIQVPNLDR